MANFVSRAGEKLEHALAKFEIDVKDKICIDFGASTGGFVDCLLQRGAAKVYAVETGYGVLDWKLRNDSRVVVMERTNALHAEFPQKVDFISIDTSWTKQKLIVAKALENLKDDGFIVSLVKPHYEAERHMLSKGVLDEKYMEEVLEKAKKDIEGLGANVIGKTESPIEGKRGGNKEFLFWIKK
jgi:23S rRNA (cytidine1920-2'-O)/16S rRNA (cytidine1409-2'-O)-methyltransferase